MPYLRKTRVASAARAAHQSRTGYFSLGLWQGEAFKTNEGTPVTPASWIDAPSARTTDHRERGFDN